MLNIKRKLNILGRPQISIDLFNKYKGKCIKNNHLLHEPQVDINHYNPQNYDTFETWSHYWFQINAVLDMEPSSVLEIGIGNGIITDYLRKQAKLNVTTFDIDPGLDPDVVGDVININRYFGEGSFDVVICCQVLEHMPFEYFQSTVVKLSSLCKKGLVLGLPRYGRRLSLHMLLGRIFLRLDWMVPKIYMLNEEYPFSGEHYWEINTGGIRDKTITEILNNYFNKVSEVCVWGDPYHVIYINKK
jgi:2-polyprenyl-3-methyl-5-hydroxy-6-metoxy-1,4-benzoquinol methylase